MKSIACELPGNRQRPPAILLKLVFRGVRYHRQRWCCGEAWATARRGDHAARQRTQLDEHRISGAARPRVSRRPRPPRRSDRHAPFSDGRAGVADAVQAHLRPCVSQPAAELFHRGVGCAWPAAFAHEDTCPPAHAKSYATMSAHLAAAVAGPQRAATRGRAAPGGHRQAEV